MTQKPNDSVFAVSNFAEIKLWAAWHNKGERGGSLIGIYSTAQSAAIACEQHAGNPLSWQAPHRGSILTTDKRYGVEMLWLDR